MALEFSRHCHYWVKRWLEARLPVFADTGKQLGVLLPRVEQARPNAIADAVLRDPLFALQALRGINGMTRGRYGAPVLDMSNVVLLLGPRRFIEQFSGLPTLEGAALAPQLRLEYLHRVRAARLAAMLAAEWGRLRLDMKGEELYLAALLHPLREWLVLFDGELQQALASGTAEAVAQRDWLFSREALDIYAELLLQWKMPEYFIDLMMENRQHSTRAQCVSMAVQMATQLDRGWFDPELLQVLKQTASMLKVDIDVLWPLIRQTLLREARQHPVPDIPPLAALLPLMPPQPVEATPSSPAPDKIPNEPTLPEKGVLLLRTLPADVPFKRVIAVALQVLLQNFGLARLVFLMPDGRQLRARQTFGDEGWKALSVDLDGQQLFARVMGKTQTLWMHGDNQQRLRPLMTADQLRLLGDAPWFAASLCRPGQPLALIIAARASGGSPLSTEDYLSFQRLAQELARRLG